MRADQHRHPPRGERVQLLPEVAPRLGVDSGRRLVEEQQLRVVQQARGKRQALLPAARERAGELVPTLRQSEVRERLLDLLLPVGHAIHACDEAQVLANGEILPERKALRHIADVALDLLGLVHDVVSQAGALAAVGRKQPAEHAD